MAKLPSWKTLSKEKRVNIEYLRVFNIICVERLGRVFFDYRGTIVGEFLGNSVKLSKDAPEEARILANEFAEDIKVGVYRYPVAITQI